MTIGELLIKIALCNQDAKVCIDANDDCCANTVVQYTNKQGKKYVYICDNTDYLDENVDYIEKEVM